jgi:hypothetical protein
MLHSKLKEYSSQYRTTHNNGKKRKKHFVSSDDGDELRECASLWANNSLTLVSQLLSFGPILLDLGSKDSLQVKVVYTYVSAVLPLFESIVLQKMGWLSNSIASIANACCQFLSLILPRRGDSGGDAEMMNLLNYMSRILKSIVDNQDITKHAPYMFVSFVNFLSKQTIEHDDILQALYPGLFHILSKCRQKQRAQIHELLALQSRAFYDELYVIYLRDYKFGVSEERF